MSIRTLLITGALSLSLVYGCADSPTDTDSFNAMDGSAGALTAEIADMGDAALEPLVGAGASKALAETVYVDVVVKPWAFDAACEGWVRETAAQAGEASRTRRDTVWFYDAAGATVQAPSLTTVASYRHVRSVNASLYHTWDSRFEMDVTIEKGTTDTLFVYNGTFSGSYDSEQYRGTDIEGVKRRLVRYPTTHLGFPTEGTITADRPLRTLTVEFGGEATAIATVTRKRDGQTTVFWIDIETGEESA